MNEKRAHRVADQVQINLDELTKRYVRLNRLNSAKVGIAFGIFIWTIIFVWRIF